jgi:hypothetical protein
MYLSEPILSISNINNSKEFKENAKIKQNRITE